MGQTRPSTMLLSRPRWRLPGAKGLVRDLMGLNQGQVAVLLALSILPIALMAGFAIDFQLLTSRKAKAQYTLDSAVIAGTRAYREGASKEAVAGIVQRYYMSALSSTEGGLNCELPVVTIDEIDVEASTKCSMATTLSAVGGIDEMSFGISTATTYGVGKVDVAFVFDVSGSMDGSRIHDLKIAAHDAVNTLIPENPPPGQEDDIRLSMVAYNGSFNAGSYFQAVTGETPDMTDTYWDNYRDEYRTRDYYSTCVYERTGSEEYTDTAPGPGNYMEPISYNRYYDYYNRYRCSDAAPLTLTSNEQPLHDYIDALEAGGNTAGHLGVAWGWYTISPNWAGIWPSDSTPHPYDEPDTAKAIILMTDGAFNTKGEGWGSDSSSNQAEALCDNIKEEDVIIYSVAFQAPYAGEQVLKYCASGDENFFRPQDGEELTDAYRAIAASISDLRITH
ncbi:pilus assembly protein [Henriciella aquimarina]|uniref:pilus assembly protein n=1 Tax=Henriciella aquimarina TaxID=545261 RepID=UPI0009FFEE0E|nr:pilus assembly protein [Henriciella aquimarina]